MAKHARVAWTPIAEPWVVEKRLLSMVPLPLNLQGNKHPFVLALRSMRKAAKEVAKGTPVVSDNGGARRREGKRIEA